MICVDISAQGPLFRLHQITGNVTAKLVSSTMNFRCLGALQVLDRSQQPPNPCPMWASDEAWDNLASLDQLPAFRGLASSLESAAQEWELWFRQPEPETAELPREWEAKCNELQRLLLICSMRPDRLLFAATTYVANTLGHKFVDPPVLNLAETYADSTPLSPLVFILSPGVDPTDLLKKLAAEKDMSNKLHIVALGQGQVGGCWQAEELLLTFSFASDMYHLQPAHSVKGNSGS